MIADVFKAQWSEPVKALIANSGGKMVAVPNNMTHIFQPLDLTVNRSCKAYLRKLGQDWYADQVSAQLLNGIKPENVSVDVRISTLKPVHAKWVVSFYDRMQGDKGKEIIVKGWDRAGITNLTANLNPRELFVTRKLIHF